MTSSNRAPRANHDRGSVTPLVVAMVAVFASVATAVSGLASSVRLEMRARTAAEAMALAVAQGSDLRALVRSYGVDGFTVEAGDGSVTVRVRLRGAVSEATAVDHRRTLGRVG